MKNIVNKLLSLVSAIIFFILASINVADAAKDCGSKDPIVIPAHNWSSQIVMSLVVGQLFEKLGCKVKYIYTDNQSVYESIRLGEITIELAVWESLFAKSFNSALDKGGMLDAGTHDAITREEWWLPDFAIQMCPGLPDWKFLNKCSDMFARPGSDGKGVYIDGPVEWLRDNKRIEALGMNFVTVNVNKTAALWTELETAYKNKKPIVLFNWSPNFTDALYGGQFVEFPTFHKKCKTDASWGINPNMTHDCGSPPGGYLKKAAWEGMPAKWPTAYNALTRINFTTKHIGTMTMYVDIEKMENVDAAKRWIEENKKVWEPWLYDSQ